MIAPDPVTPWRLPAYSIAWRLFFTAWIVYGLHVATDVVREHYLAAAIAEGPSFRVDAYAGLHPDLFEVPGRGWRIGNNPGASMIAAVPYAVARPIVEAITRRVQERRVARGDTVPPAFNSPRPNARVFFAAAYRRGLDIKLGLMALVMQWFCMAPIAAAGVALVFAVLRGVLRDDRQALGASLLYAFATPVFFRAGFLNQNLMLAVVSFAGFAVAWNPWHGTRLSPRARTVLAGLAAGVGLLLDYAAAPLALGLAAYVSWRPWRSEGLRGLARQVSWFTLGAVGPVLVLWWYQYVSFGHPFLPGQAWMPRVHYSVYGYNGYSWPRLDIFLLLAFDPRYGLLALSPLLALGLSVPFVRGAREAVPRVELVAMLGVVSLLWLFHAGNLYTYLQWNAGIRYMIPAIPFLLVPAVLVLRRMPSLVVWAVVILSVTLNWSLAMYRYVLAPIGVLDPVLRTFIGGLTLPLLRTMAFAGDAYGGFADHGVSALPLLLLTSGALVALWSLPVRAKRS